MTTAKSKKIAVCGLMAAASVVIMILGGLIPLSTYVCPMLACLLCYVVFKSCGIKLTVVWYFAVSVLVLLMGPDKEAALVFLLLGYYPILKPKIDKSPLRMLLKLLYFNCSVLLLIVLVAAFMGLNISEELLSASLLMTLLMLVLGNIVFLLLDRLLNILECKSAHRRKHG